MRIAKLVTTTLLIGSIATSCGSDHKTALSAVIENATKTGQLVDPQAVPGSKISDGKATIIQTSTRDYAALGPSDMVEVADGKSQVCVLKQSNPTDSTPVFVIRTSACPDPMTPADPNGKTGNPSDAYVSTVMVRYTQRTTGSPLVPVNTELLANIAAELTAEGRPTTIVVKTATSFELTAENATSCFISDGTNSSTQAGPCP